MSAQERLMRYCSIDTQSDPNNEGETPSSQKQFDLARMLVKELKELGLEDVELDEHCYVYGRLPSNLGHPSKTVGFLAHMDTAPDFSGANVKPRIIEGFDGCDIQLNEEVVLRMDDFPAMRNLKGKTLMVTDGNTLLGADDKAGITCIMEALEYLKTNKDTPHGDIAIAFTPDEEIGNGPKYFNVEKFNADFAYTMDGGTVSELSSETFNAASAEVEFNGFTIHPGSAKGKMINAASVACEFNSLLPRHMRPEHTEGRDGFIHLISMSGACEHALLSYILRDHDAGLLEKKKDILKNAASYLNSVYGEGTIKVDIRDSYRNMKEVIDANPECIVIATQAMKRLGITPLCEPVRGGTDGARLSFMGLPCPNLGNGGGNFHGRYEYCVMEELEMARDVILNIVDLIAKEVQS